MIAAPTSSDLAGESPFFSVAVTRKEKIASDIYLFELRRPDGADLPPFTAGAHLTVEIPNGTRRNYSLCGNPQDNDVYQIAVKRDPAGRGGSVSLVDTINAGDTLAISMPRNNFEIELSAVDFIFIAGGIGITPILSMMRHVKHAGIGKFKLYYFTRDAASTAFMHELSKTEFAGQVHIHHDNGDIEQAFDLWPVLEKPGKAHVYCCGPRGLMDGVRDMSGHWPSNLIHFESFGVNAASEVENKPFSVRLQKSGVTVEVGAQQSILDALRDAGYRVPSSCESGTCGSCRTRLVAGVADHRDMVLQEDERATQIMVCVSRAESEELVLDL